MNKNRARRSGQRGAGNEIEKDEIRLGRTCGQVDWQIGRNAHRFSEGKGQGKGQVEACGRETTKWTSQNG